jgi:hypothetical protein
MVELAAVRTEVEAAAAANAARAAAAELKALRASSTDSSVSVDDDRDNKLKLASGQPRTPRDAVAAALTGADAPTTLRAGACAATAQTGADVSTTGLTEIAAFTGGTTLPPRTGTMVIMGSRPLLGTSVPTAGGIPSPRPTTSSGLR